MIYTSEYKKFLLTTNRPEVRLLKLKKLAGEPIDLTGIKEARFGDLSDTETEKLVKFISSLVETEAIKLLLCILTHDFKLVDSSTNVKKAEKFLSRKEFMNYREVMFKKL